MISEPMLPIQSREYNKFAHNKEKWSKPDQSRNWAGLSLLIRGRWIMIVVQSLQSLTQSARSQHQHRRHEISCSKFIVTRESQSIASTASSCIYNLVIANCGCYIATRHASSSFEPSTSKPKTNGNLSQKFTRPSSCIVIAVIPHESHICRRPDPSKLLSAVTTMSLTRWRRSCA